MTSLSYEQRVLRIVYCGASECGKTTNLESLSRMLPSQYQSRLVKLATETERTLYFDLLTLSVGDPVTSPNSVRLELFTVPGQNFYQSARRRVLKEANGIVFVADCRQERLDANIEALSDVLETIEESGRNPDDVPAVLQLNRSDDPTALPYHQILEALGCEGEPYVEAIATQGRGVIETLRLIWRYAITSHVMVEPSF